MARHYLQHRCGSREQQVAKLEIHLATVVDGIHIAQQALDFPGDLAPYLSHRLGRARLAWLQYDEIGCPHIVAIALGGILGFRAHRPHGQCLHSRASDHPRKREPDIVRGMREHDHLHSARQGVAAQIAVNLDQGVFKGLADLTFYGQGSLCVGIPVWEEMGQFLFNPSKEKLR